MHSHDCNRGRAELCRSDGRRWRGALRAGICFALATMFRLCGPLRRGVSRCADSRFFGASRSRAMVEPEEACANCNRREHVPPYMPTLCRTRCHVGARRRRPGQRGRAGRRNRPFSPDGSGGRVCRSVRKDRRRDRPQRPGGIAAHCRLLSCRMGKPRHALRHGIRTKRIPVPGFSPAVLGSVREQQRLEFLDATYLNAKIASW